MNDPYFFGYGSLVNRATHAYTKCHKAQITGWKRAWCATPFRDACILSAVPCQGVMLDGLIAAVPNADWAALDRREIFYGRHLITPQITHSPQAAADIVIYEIPPSDRATPTDQNPILLSYLDVVVQGYLAEFGDAGVAAFFDTTDNWHAPILNDRENPIYPRAQTLTASETALVDHHIARITAARP